MSHLEQHKAPHSSASPAECASEIKYDFCCSLLISCLKISHSLGIFIATILKEYWKMLINPIGPLGLTLFVPHLSGWSVPSVWCRSPSEGAKGEVSPLQDCPFAQQGGRHQRHHRRPQRLPEKPERTSAHVQPQPPFPGGCRCVRELGLLSEATIGNDSSPSASMS